MGFLDLFRRRQREGDPDYLDDYLEDLPEGDFDEY